MLDGPNLSRAECGTHAMFNAEIDTYATSEMALAKRLVDRLEPDMVLPADRGFTGFALWEQASATGADLLWRAKNNAKPRQIDELETHQRGPRMVLRSKSPALVEQEINVARFRVVAARNAAEHTDVRSPSAPSHIDYRPTATTYFPTHGRVRQPARCVGVRHEVERQRVPRSLHQLAQHCQARLTPAALVRADDRLRNFARRANSVCDRPA